LYILKTAVIISILFILIFFGSQFSWLNYTSTISKDLFSKAITDKKLVNLEELKELPEPVQKYFKLVLKDKSEIINRAYISQDGKFRMDETKENFLKTQAQQFFSNDPHAFTWHAKIYIDAGIYINVFDSYVDSKGALKAKFLSLYTIVDEKDKKELNEGELQRYLAEALWYPTALLPSESLKWSSIDKNTALATISDGGISTSLEFRFNKKGEISSIYTPKRFREKDGVYVSTPWLCEVSNYVEKDGYLVPQDGQVSWILDNKKFTYYKLKIKDVKYN
jgi:hypothetical protein